MINKNQQKSIEFSDGSSPSSSQILGEINTYDICVNALTSLSVEQKIDLSEQSLTTALEELQNNDGKDLTSPDLSPEVATLSVLLSINLMLKYLVRK